MYLTPGAGFAAITVPGAHNLIVRKQNKKKEKPVSSITRDDLLWEIAKERLQTVNSARLVCVQANKAYQSHLNDNPDLERDRLHKVREDAKIAYFKTIDPHEYSDEIEGILASMTHHLMQCKLQTNPPNSQVDNDNG